MTWKRNPGRMNSRVSPAQGSRRRRLPARAPPWSPPRSPARRAPRICAMAAQASGGTTTRSSCSTCRSRSGLRTGWKVPAPTCSVTQVRRTPRASRARHQRGIEMQAGGGRRDRAAVARKHALVALAVLRLPRRAGYRAAAARRRESRRTPAPRPACAPATGPAAAPGSAPRRRPSRFPARPDRLAGAQLHQRGAVREDALEEHLDATAGGLGPHHPRRDHARVVEDQQVARLQQTREVADRPVQQPPAGPAPAVGLRSVRAAVPARSGRQAGHRQSQITARAHGTTAEQPAVDWARPHRLDRLDHDRRSHDAVVPAACPPVPGSSSAA